MIWSGSKNWINEVPQNRSKHGTRSAHVETELMWEMAWESNGGKMAMSLNGTGTA